MCEGCGGEIDRNDPTLVRAYLKAGVTDETVEEELEILFHADCFPTDSPVWGRR
jgi:hypothetical protein